MEAIRNTEFYWLPSACAKYPKMAVKKAPFDNGAYVMIVKVNPLDSYAFDGFSVKKRSTAKILENKKNEVLKQIKITIFFPFS